MNRSSSSSSQENEQRKRYEVKLFHIHAERRSCRRSFIGNSLLHASCAEEAAELACQFRDAGNQPLTDSGRDVEAQVREFESAGEWQVFEIHGMTFVVYKARRVDI